MYGHVPLLVLSMDYGFKHSLDSYLMNIVDHPCVPGFNNSLDGGDYQMEDTL